MKFTKGDYIRYTAENEQEVIDGLMGMGYEVYNHDRLNSGYDNFVLKDDDSFSVNGFGFVRSCKNSNRLLIADRTEDFFAYLSDKKPSEEQLPSKFYIECGDRIEVREWLHNMGFKWVNGASITNTKNVYDLKKIYVKSEEMACSTWFKDKEEYTLIKPKLTVTSFEVERTQSDGNERRKEIEELKRLHNEIGERLDALLSS